MYWWNLRAAKRDLSAERLDSRQLLPYIIVFAVLETAAVNLSVLLPGSEGSPGTRQWVLVAVSALLSALGCVYVYRRNGGAKGERFLERFLVLGWVTGVRFMAFVFLAFLVFVVFAGDLPPVVNWVGTDVVFELINPLFYLYLGHHVGQLARSDPRPGG